MIISHKHQFVFIHCRKTAGSSIAAYLNKFIGPTDLQIGSWVDAREAGGGLNRRVIKESASTPGLLTIAQHARHEIMSGYAPSLTRLINAGQKDLYRPVLGQKPEHPEAKHLKEYAGEAWDAYFKFCFVRNPYDRAVSDFKWRQRERAPISFIEYLQRLEDPQRPDPEGIVPRPYDNWDLYTIDDTIAADYVGRFENLLNDFEAICATVGLPFRPEALPHAKGSSDLSPTYREWYGPEEKAIVRRVFAKEIEYFGYSF